jgi:hypothetical protein
MKEEESVRNHPKNSTGPLARRSRKGTVEIGVKAKLRGEAARARQRQKQHEAERPDRGGPQGRKDKDFQRKF